MIFNKYDKVAGNYHFLYFLMGQGAAYLSDAFQLTAIPILIYNMTGSWTITAVTAVFQPVTNIILSSVAGSLGDRLSGKYSLIFLDLLRAFTVLMFTYSRNIPIIYALSFMMSILITIYNPPAKKMMVNLFWGEGLVIGNSLLTGALGTAYLFGPALAGILIKSLGIKATFFICSLFYVFSVLMTSAIKVRRNQHIDSRNMQENGLYDDIKEGFWYFKHNNHIQNIVILDSLMCFGEASINIAYYPFTFEVLRLSSEGWGFILSIFNGANLAAMFISILLSRKINTSKLSFVYLPIILISVSWLVYGITTNLNIIFLTLTIEGTAFSFCTTYLLTKLQTITSRKYTARMVGINDIVNSAPS